MKILLVYSGCQVGGVETFMVSLCRVLRARGYVCELFFFQHGPMEMYLPPDWVVHFGDLADCMKLVSSRGFNIVHANSTDWVTGISAVRNIGTKLVVTAHGMIVSSWNPTNYDAFVCCSRWQAKEQEAYTRVPVYTVLNGIDTDKFKPSTQAAATSPPIVGWVGRSTALDHKRIDTLAAIAPTLHRAGVRLWLADPCGPDELKELAPEVVRTLLPLADFWSAVSLEKMADFFQEIAASGGCILSTSSYEGLPLSLAEAQACGCPVIGADVRGVNEVVDPESGGVLYPLDIRDEPLADLVLKTLRDTERMQWRREACAQHVREKFSLERMVQDYIRIYDEVLKVEHKSPAAVRARLWLAPLLDWEDYVEQRWTAGWCHYEVSRKLAEQGEWALASQAARLSLVTCPTLYAKPGRLAYLIKILLRTNPYRTNARR